MHEYEFRLVVQNSTDSSMVPVLESIFRRWLEEDSDGSRHQLARRRIVRVAYAKPHFRCRPSSPSEAHAWEVKRKVSTRAVYHDTVWFQWVHSLEIPFERWTRSTCAEFMNVVGNYQNPLVHETRVHVQLDANACLYAFDNRLVFEWECGVFREKLSSALAARDLQNALSAYRDIYTAMYPNYSFPPLSANNNRHTWNERLVRKPVVCVDSFLSLDRERDIDAEGGTEGRGGKRYLMAHKVDGTFGFVEGHFDHVKEKWEGYERRVRSGMALKGKGGRILDGFVFAAEKCLPGVVVLLDVYQVRGHPVAGWSRRAILTEFLPSLKLPDGYIAQVYRNWIKYLPRNLVLPTDGYIAHDVVLDLVYKIKERHTIDVVYHGGWFRLANQTRMACPVDPAVELCEGRVYELSMEGNVIRERKDRFTGNTTQQLEKIFDCSPWRGPLLEKVPASDQQAKRRRNKRQRC